MIKCNQCGAPNKDGQEKCYHCGLALPLTMHINTKSSKTPWITVGVIALVLIVVVGVTLSRPNNATSNRVIPTESQRTMSSQSNQELQNLDKLVGNYNSCLDQMEKFWFLGNDNLEEIKKYDVGSQSVKDLLNQGEIYIGETKKAMADATNLYTEITASPYYAGNYRETVVTRIKENAPGFAGADLRYIEKR